MESKIHVETNLWMKEVMITFYLPFLPFPSLSFHPVPSLDTFPSLPFSLSSFLLSLSLQTTFTKCCYWFPVAGLYPDVGKVSGEGVARCAALYCMWWCGVVRWCVVWGSVVLWGGGVVFFLWCWGDDVVIWSIVCVDSWCCCGGVWWDGVWLWSRGMKFCRTE